MTAHDEALFVSVSAEPVDEEMIALEARLRAAQLTADVAALDALLDDRLLFVGPDGQLATKAQDLEAHRSGVVRFVSHEPEALHVRRIHDGVALTFLRARLAVQVGDTRVTGTYRYTRTWARDAHGTWRVAGGHVASVPDTPSPSTTAS
jgi:ketosteroid isomerase-like protein